MQENVQHKCCEIQRFTKKTRKSKMYRVEKYKPKLLFEKLCSGFF